MLQASSKEPVSLGRQVKFAGTEGVSGTEDPALLPAPTPDASGGFRPILQPVEEGGPQPGPPPSAQEALGSPPPELLSVLPVLLLPPDAAREVQELHGRMLAEASAAAALGSESDDAVVHELRTKIFHNYIARSDLRWAPRLNPCIDPEQEEYHSQCARPSCIDLLPSSPTPPAHTGLPAT